MLNTIFLAILVLTCIIIQYRFKLIGFNSIIKQFCMYFCSFVPEVKMFFVQINVYYIIIESGAFMLFSCAVISGHIR